MNEYVTLELSSCNKLIQLLNKSRSSLQRLKTFKSDLSRVKVNVTPQSFVTYVIIFIPENFQLKWDNKGDLVFFWFSSKATSVINTPAPFHKLKLGFAGADYLIWSNVNPLVFCHACLLFFHYVYQL